jgi:hypothetical protein
MACVADAPGAVDRFSRLARYRRPEEIEFILPEAQAGRSQALSNAKAIFWLGAGVDHLVKDADLRGRCRSCGWWMTD